MMSLWDVEVQVTRDSPMWCGVFLEHQKLLERLALMTLQTVLPHNAWMGHKTFEIQVSLTSDEEVARLNQDYRDRSGPTNVLSFHQFDTLQDVQQEAIQEQIAIVCLGDLVFSDQTVFDEAIRYNRPLHDHMAHLFVHGLLHLLGYDHKDDQEAFVMESLEVDILEKNGIPDPYQML